MRRSDQRRDAVFARYQHDVTGRPLEELLGRARPFTRELAEGVEAHRDELDELIGRHARAGRSTGSRRSIATSCASPSTRCAHRDDVPIEVAIDEAVELAKEYCGADAPGFINGMLGRGRAGAGAGAVSHSGSGATARDHRPARGDRRRALGRRRRGARRASWRRGRRARRRGGGGGRPAAARGACRRAEPPTAAEYPEDLRELVDSLARARCASRRSRPTAGLEEAMRYSLLAGGKRIRPVLALATARALGRRARSASCRPPPRSS